MPQFYPFFFDGQLAVSVFFVLSGYVLSVGFLERGNPGILTALAVRRYPRLTIPILASCLLAYVLIKIGAMHHVEAGRISGNNWLLSFYDFPVSLYSVLKYSTYDVYIAPDVNSYNIVLWTMRHELFGSMFVLFGLYVLRGRMLRSAGYFFSILVTVYYQSPLLAFVFGVMLADATPLLRDLETRNLGLCKILATVLLVPSLASIMIRPQYFISPVTMSSAAAIVLFSILIVPDLRSFLSTRVSIALGHLSFPLYLTHLLVILSASSWFYATVAGFGVPPVTLSVMTFIVTAVLSYLAAVSFAPVERFAISFSRHVSDFTQPQVRLHPTS